MQQKLSHFLTKSDKILSDCQTFFEKRPRTTSESMEVTFLEVAVDVYFVWIGSNRMQELIWDELYLDETISSDFQTL